MTLDKEELTKRKSVSAERLDVDGIISKFREYDVIPDKVFDRCQVHAAMTTTTSEVQYFRTYNMFIALCRVTKLAPSKHDHHPTPTYPHRLIWRSASRPEIAMVQTTPCFAECKVWSWPTLLAPPIQLLPSQTLPAMPQQQLPSP